MQKPNADLVNMRNAEQSMRIAEQTIGYIIW